MSKIISDTLNIASMQSALAMKTSFSCAALPHRKEMIEKAADQPLPCGFSAGEPKAKQKPIPIQRYLWYSLCV